MVLAANKLNVPFAHSNYEQQFAMYLGENQQAFSFWKGRVALYAILKALGVGEGDEVMVPGYTCVVVPNAIRLTGAKPVYVDIQPGSYVVDADRLESAITPKTKVILVQHTYGLAAPVADVLAVARLKGIAVVEDAAHALGTTLQGQKLGTQGDAAFFSSQWSKPYTTGLGGMAVTGNPDLAAKLAQIKQSFVTPPQSEQAKLQLEYQIYKRFYSPRLYWMAQGLLHAFSRVGLFVGSSSEEELEGAAPKDHTWWMADAQEKAGIAGLDKMPTEIARKMLLTKFYDDGLTEKGWGLPKKTADTVLLRYPVRIRNKVELLQKAREQKMELGSWFETPLHPVSLEKHTIFSYTMGNCPEAEMACEQVVNLPLNEWISVAEADRVLEFFLKNAKPI